MVELVELVEFFYNVMLALLLLLISVFLILLLVAACVVLVLVQLLCAVFNEARDRLRKGRGQLRKGDDAH